jgi:hypothetical protein
MHVGPKLPQSFPDTNLIPIENWKTHPDYRIEYDEKYVIITGHNDIAVVKLSQDAPIDRAQPVPILRPQAILVPRQTLLLAGYGILDDKDPQTPVFAKELHYARVPLERVWNNILITDQTGGRGACAGDSGGPAYVETSTGLVLVGVTRGPHNKALDCHHYGEYTYASRFESFILEAAKELGGEPPQFIDGF